MRTAAWIASLLIVLLGFLHIAVTFFQYDGLAFEAVWFFGTGVAIVLAGLLNVAMLREGGKDIVVWSMALASNLFFLLGFAAASYMMRQPQVFVGALLFAITTFYSFRVNDGSKH
jgi:hypothetical protein